MKKEELYIKRCFDLAVLGKGKVAPNPMVGAVIVYNDRIIGEGFHTAYGKAHAEVNAVANVKKEDLKYLSESTIYISLEPCCIHGNTPPCTDLIIKNKVPKVVFSSIDNTPGVDGKSIQLLKNGGIDVKFGLSKKQGDQICRIRNTFVTQKRPFVILKWAQSFDGFIGKIEEPVWLTNSISRRLVHKWRSETDAILVGTNTAQIDNPKLTNRLYSGKDPLRIVFDEKLRLSKNLNIYDDSVKTWIITEQTVEKSKFKNTKFVQIDFDKELIINLMDKLYENKISSLIVEGGSKMLETFIGLNLWDEARIFVADKFLEQGVGAPALPYKYSQKFKIDSDQLYVFQNSNPRQTSLLN